MPVKTFEIIGQTVFEIIEEQVSCRTNEHDEDYRNSASVSPKKRRNVGLVAGLMQVADDIHC